MSRNGGRPQTATQCFPHVSGDEPQAVAKNGQTLEFSPRERG